MNIMVNVAISPHLHNRTQNSKTVHQTMNEETESSLLEDSQQIWSSSIIIPVKQSHDSDTIVDFDVNTVFTGDTRTSKIKLGTLHDTCKQIAIPADSSLKQVMETACRDAGFNSVVQKAHDTPVGLTRIRVRCVRNILHQPRSTGKRQAHTFRAKDRSLICPMHFIIYERKNTPTSSDFFLPIIQKKDWGKHMHHCQLDRKQLARRSYLRPGSNFIVPSEHEENSTCVFGSIMDDDESIECNEHRQSLLQSLTPQLKFLENRIRNEEQRKMVYDRFSKAIDNVTLELMRLQGTESHTAGSGAASIPCLTEHRAIPARKRPHMESTQT